MPTLKLKRRLPQKFALTARRGRTPLEQAYAEGTKASPLSFSGYPQSSALTGMATTPTSAPAPAPSVPDSGFIGGDVGEAAEGPGLPQTAEDIMGHIIGDEIAGTLGFKGLKGGSLAALIGSLKGAPLSAYPKGVLGAISRGMFAPAAVAKALNIGLGAQPAANAALEEGSMMTGLTDDPVTGSLGAIQAFQNEPHTLTGRAVQGLKGMMGRGPSPSEDPTTMVAAGKAATTPTGPQDPTTINEAIQNALTQSIQQQGYNLDETGIAALQASTGMHSDSPVGGGASLGGGGNVGPGAGPGPAAGQGSPGDAGDGDGGTVLCTVLHEKGIMPDKMYMADSEYGKSLSQDVIDGYHVWAITVAGWMTKSELFLKIMSVPVMSWGKHMAGQRTFFGTICEKIGVPACRLIGRLRNRLATTSLKARRLDPA
jgi:hypothetical protein